MFFSYPKLKTPIPRSNSYIIMQYICKIRKKLNEHRVIEKNRGRENNTLNCHKIIFKFIYYLNSLLILPLLKSVFNFEKCCTCQPFPPSLPPPPPPLSLSNIQKCYNNISNLNKVKQILTLYLDIKYKMRSSKQ